MRLTFNHLNEEPLSWQELELGYYDVIIASSKLLSNKSFLRQARKMLKLVGRMICYEPCKANANGEIFVSNRTSSLLTDMGYTHA